MRPLLLLIGGLSLFFAASVGAARLVASGAPLLDDFTPTGCRTSCFLGIELGITSMEEALGLIEGHPWVRDLTVTERPDGQLYSIDWAWNGAQPSWLTGRAEVRRKWGAAGEIDLRTTAAFGDVWLRISRPSYLASRPAGGYTVYFPSSGLVAGSAIVPSCQAWRSGFWRSQVTLAFDIDLLERPPTRDRIAERLQAMRDIACG
jgi:hypothetical protein